MTRKDRTQNNVTFLKDAIKAIINSKLAVMYCTAQSQKNPDKYTHHSFMSSSSSNKGQNEP